MNRRQYLRGIALAFFIGYALMAVPIEWRPEAAGLAFLALIGFHGDRWTRMK